MSRKKPNFLPPYRTIKSVNDFINQVFSDAWISQHTPDSGSLDNENNTIILILQDKKFVDSALPVDSYGDYVDIYLQGLRINSDKYSVTVSDNDIVITISQDVTARPDLLDTTDFVIKGKIAERTPTE